MQHNFRTLVAAEAVGDLDPALHAVHLRDIDARYADVMSVDDLLADFQSLPRLGRQPIGTQRGKQWT